MTLRGAIVGFGEVARNGHWPAWAACSDARIVAVVDRTPERRALVASLAPAIETFATLDELASAMTIDFVDICTPPALHHEPMLDAIARGWHVLCEKPFLLDPIVLDVVRRLAAERGVAVLPVHNWKHAPIIRRATETLLAGAIGPLRRVEIETCRTREAAGADPARPDWRRDSAIAGGGILMDHGWHAVYLALHWFGRQAIGVRASLHRPPEGGVDDEASVTIEFPGGEATIALTWNGDERRNTIRFSGARGTVVIADDTLHIRGTRDESIRFARALSAGSHHDDWFAAMLPTVVAAFQNPALAGPSFEEAAECLSIIQQAYRHDPSLAAPPR
jgi:predicted dehydrogenase